MKIIKQWIGEAGARLAAWSGSPAPSWHTAQELYDYLRHQNYDRVIAEELSAKYAENLQRSFAKGYSFGLRKAKQENDRGELHRPVSGGGSQKGQSNEH